MYDVVYDGLKFSFFVVDYLLTTMEELESPHLVTIIIISINKMEKD